MLLRAAMSPYRHSPMHPNRLFSALLAALAAGCASPPPPAYRAESFAADSPFLSRSHLPPVKSRTSPIMPAAASLPLSDR